MVPVRKDRVHAIGGHMDNRDLREAVARHCDHVPAKRRQRACRRRNRTAHVAPALRRELALDEQAPCADRHLADEDLRKLPCAGRAVDRMERAAADARNLPQERIVRAVAHANRADRDALRARRVGDRRSLLGRAHGLAVSEHHHVARRGARIAQLVKRDAHRRELVRAAARPYARDDADRGCRIADALARHDDVRRVVECDDAELVEARHRLDAGDRRRVRHVLLDASCAGHHCAHRSRTIDHQRDACAHEVACGGRVHLHGHRLRHVALDPAARAERTVAPCHHESAAEVVHVRAQHPVGGVVDRIPGHVRQDHRVVRRERRHIRTELLWRHHINADPSCPKRAHERIALGACRVHHKHAAIALDDHGGRSNIVLRDRIRARRVGLERHPEPPRTRKFHRERDLDGVRAWIERHAATAARRVRVKVKWLVILPEVEGAHRATLAPHKHPHRCGLTEARARRQPHTFNHRLALVHVLERKDIDRYPVRSRKLRHALDAACGLVAVRDEQDPVHGVRWQEGKRTLHAIRQRRALHVGSLHG